MIDIIGYGIMLIGMIVGFVKVNVFVMFPFIFLGMCVLMARDIIWRMMVTGEPITYTISDVLNSGIIELMSGGAAILGVYYILQKTTHASEHTKNASLKLNECHAVSSGNGQGARTLLGSGQSQDVSGLTEAHIMGLSNSQHSSNVFENPSRRS